MKYYIARSSWGHFYGGSPFGFVENSWRQQFEDATLFSTFEEANAIATKALETNDDVVVLESSETYIPPDDEEDVNDSYDRAMGII